MRLVWFSEIKWTYIKNRHHQLIENFPSEWRILFLETYVVGKANSFRPRHDGRVTYVTIPFLKGTPYPAVNRLQSWALVQWAAGIIAWIWVRWIFFLTGFSTRRRSFVVSNIYFATIVRWLRKDRLVYDCNDYPMGFPGALPMAEQYFSRLIRTADAVACVSERLREDVDSCRPGVATVIGNGVDMDLFESGRGSPLPADLRGVQTPVVLYCGAISEWFNLDLVLRIAERYPDASVVIIGPILTPRIRERLGEAARFSNIRFLGPKPHAELPAYVHRSAVGLIPFLKDPLIARFNPNKLYEYMACGKPVVTLDYTSEIARLRGLIHVASNDDEFVSMVGETLQARPDETALIQMARQNSWSHKAEAMRQLILGTN